jgi:Flp pilus assembly pilin Flp
MHRVAFAAQIQGGRMLYLTTRVASLFRRNEDGQDLLEYALLIALIAIVAVTAVTAAGAKVDAIFKDIVQKLP